MSARRSRTTEEPEATLFRLVGFSEPALDKQQVSARAAVELDIADRLWRALGFPDVPEGEIAFTEEDVRALALATEGLERLNQDERAEALELMLHEARLASASLANLAETEIDAIGALAARGVRTEMHAEALDRGLAGSNLGWLILYVLRRQLAAALRRRADAETVEGLPRLMLAVGFVDLVDFTALSHRIEAEDLSEMLGRWEALTFDVVTKAGGRIAKLIGDEVMLVCLEPADAAGAALAIVDATERSGMPPARAGIAFGEVLRQNGDYFGRPVNLASRMVDAAPPRGVLVDESTAHAVEQAPSLTPKPTPPRPLKGFGPVPLWQVVPQ